MEIGNFLLEDIIKSQGGPIKKSYQNTVEFDKNLILNELESLKLSDISTRNEFYWELQKLIEIHVYKNPGLNDLERLSEMIVESWNLENKLKIKKPVVVTALNQMNLTFLNSQKSFNAVCDGDLRSYKIFAKDNPSMLADLLFRVAICTSETKPVEVVNDLIPLLFEKENGSMGIKSAKRLKFHIRGNFLKSKAKEYREYHTREDFVFIKGLHSILNSISKETIDDISIKSFLTKLNDFLNNDNIVNENKDEENTELNQASLKKEEVITEPETSLPLPEITKDIPSSLESVIYSLQDVISRIKEENEEINFVETNMKSKLEERLSIAEEEIKRLNLELNIEKEKTRLSEEKAYINVLQAIGGETSNYLLSDLFEESQGMTPVNHNISIGRLINLFSSLSLAIGLEEHGSGYELGNTFSLHKDTLIKEFRIDGPLKTQEEIINVKLIKFGWTLNGKVIVQPLVSETKGELLHG